MIDLESSLRIFDKKQYFWVYGIKRNAWANGIQRRITMDDLPVSYSTLMPIVV